MNIIVFKEVTPTVLKTGPDWTGPASPNRFNHRPVAFLFWFTLLNRLSIGPAMNRLNQRLDR